MKELGNILFPQKNMHPMSVIHEIMKRTYAEALAKIEDTNIVIADVTSSLNPFNPGNHVSQIEPSGQGGKQIAKMLKFMIKGQVNPKHAYRFYPPFFTSKIEDLHVEATPFDSWSPAHPWDLREGYSKREEEIYRQYNGDSRDKAEWLETLSKILVQETKTLSTAAKRVYDRAEFLAQNLPEQDLKKWKMSVILAYHLLITPRTTVDTESKSQSERPNPEYATAARLLKANAKRSAIGKSEGWKQFSDALVVLAGAALIGMGEAIAPGSGEVVLCVAGSLAAVAGAAFFYHHRQKSLSKDVENLANVSLRQKALAVKV